MVQGMQTIDFSIFFFVMLFSLLTYLLDLLQPVEVWSKCGRRGRIKEPVGTHGMSEI